jgi:hypothetical protein
MTKRVLKQLEECRDARRVVRLVRNTPDRYWNGFVEAVGLRLVVMRTFDDFVLDGFALLRLKDVQEVEWSEESSRFMVEVLQAEGRLSNLPKVPRIDLTSMHSAVSDLVKRDPYLIIECEHAKDDEGDGAFYLGRVTEVGARLVELEGVSHVGEVDDRTTRIRLSDITNVRSDEYYIDIFKRHGRWANRSR